MQKYADINRSSRSSYTRYAKLGSHAESGVASRFGASLGSALGLGNSKSSGRSGRLVVSNRKKRVTKAKDQTKTQLWILILALLLICGLYIRYQALYVENSVFRDLYRIIHEHFISKNPLPPIASEITVNKVEQPTTPNPPTKVAPASSAAVAVQSGEVAQVIPQVNLLQDIDVALYQPYVDFAKDAINFIVVSQKINFVNLGINNEMSLDEILKKVFQSMVASLVGYQSNSKNIKNLFHSKTELRNAWVENDTLILDFNQYFERSKFGYKGIDIKLQQVLWTFLNFKNEALSKPVHYISILIEGERKERIGGDGYTLKPFYSKKDLRNKVLFP